MLHYVFFNAAFPLPKRLKGNIHQTLRAELEQMDINILALRTSEYNVHSQVKTIVTERSCYYVALPMKRTEL
jgi:hypothetical protein